MPIEGIDYVGPLPDEVQRVSTFSAGIAVGARSPAAARELVAFLASPALGPVVEKFGLEQVGYDRDDWRALFNGRDLTGWTPKIRNHALGDNYADTFRVTDGVLTVAYDGYDTFDERFGHLFFARAVLALSPPHRVPLRRRASAERARLGRAQQRRHGALATARDNAARPGFPDLDRGAVPRGLERRQAAADR